MHNAIAWIQMWLILGLYFTGMFFVMGYGNIGLLIVYMLVPLVVTGGEA